MTDKEVYLLRNSSRKGLGFFETEGFYPDFLLWIWVGTMQYLTFIDPKGIRNLSGIKDEKVQLFKRLNEDIAPRLNDSNLKLNSFIISDTPFSQVPFNDIGKEEFKNNHVLFQEDKDYVKTMVEMIEGQI
jgi:hypothetical protein